MSVSVKLSGDEQCEQVMEELQLLCAAVDISSSSHDVILPVDVIDELRDLPAVNVMRMPVTVPHDVVFQVEAADVADAPVTDSTVESNCSDDVCDADCLGMSNSVYGVNELIAKQQSDDTLADCWQQAKVNKGDFAISSSVLYHKDKVEGQPICQICVPESKRVQVLKLAHNSVFGCHLGERKTRERIGLSFYWPRMRQNIQDCLVLCAVSIAI